MSIPVPKISGEIESKELHKLLKDKLSGVFNKLVIYLVDRKYQLIKKAEMIDFLNYDKTDLIKYVPEYHDCDDFSFRLMGQFSIPEWSGIAFGIAFSKVHAFNIFISDKKEIFIIEPQKDLVWRIDEVPKKYKKFFLPIRFILM
jgi:hypothetical protein